MAYAKNRKAFDQPIAKLQAIQVNMNMQCHIIFKKTGIHEVK